MPNSVPARVDRNAFFLQWADKMAELETIKEERSFIVVLTNALADVLEMDIGIAIEAFETKGLVGAPDVGYRIIHLKDTKGVLASSHPEVKEGFEFGRGTVHPYFGSVWDIKTHTFAEPVPGLGVDLFLPMGMKNIPHVGYFASPLILLDDSAVAVELDVTSIIRSEAMKLRRLYDKIASREVV